MPVYRYRLDLLNATDIATQVRGTIVLGEVGPSIYKDVEVDAGSKDDLDLYMERHGFTFVSTDPTNTPAEQASLASAKLKFSGLYIGSAGVVDAYLADSAKETSPFPLLTPVQTDTKYADLLVQAQDNGCIADLIVQFVINKVPVALKIVIPASTDGQFEVKDIMPVASKDQVDLLVTGNSAIGTAFISASMILS